jgi:hypothetical protein
MQSCLDADVYFHSQHRFALGFRSLEPCLPDFGTVRTEATNASAGGNVASRPPLGGITFPLRCWNPFGTSNYGTSPLDRVGCNQADVVPMDFAGDEVETAYHATKFLIRSHVPDIIQLRIEASLRDRLHWCGLQGSG